MPEIARVRYTHDAVIDEILQNPAISQNELAKMFGYSPTWISICINSDAFQERLEERKAELVDPAIRATIAERLEAIAKRSLEKIIDRLDSPVAMQAMKTQDLVSIAKLGVGDRNTRGPAPQTQNNLYVVNLPPQAADAQSWLATAGGSSKTPAPRGDNLIIENAPGG